MIETDSEFYTNWPHTVDFSEPAAGNIQAATSNKKATALKAAQNSKKALAAKNKQSKAQPISQKPLQNDVYSNTKIELPPPPGKGPCSGATVDGSKAKSTDKLKTTALKSVVSEKHPLWWLGGIAGALFLLGRASK